jgi:hypothetical protein
MARHLEAHARCFVRPLDREPNYQLFQHKLPFDRSSMTRWRQRMGEEKPAAHSINQKRGRLRCHKRPKSREETPKEGIGGNNLTAPQQYARAMHKKQVGLSVFF